MINYHSKTIFLLFLHFCGYLLISLFLFSIILIDVNEKKKVIFILLAMFTVCFSIYRLIGDFANAINIYFINSFIHNIQNKHGFDFTKWIRHFFASFFYFRFEDASNKIVKLWLWSTLTSTCKDKALLSSILTFTWHYSP